MGEITYQSKSLEVEIVPASLEDLQDGHADRPTFDIMAGNTSGAELAIVTNARVIARIDDSTGEYNGRWNPAEIRVGRNAHDVTTGDAPRRQRAASHMSVSPGRLRGVIGSYPELARDLPEDDYTAATMHHKALQGSVIGLVSNRSWLCPVQSNLREVRLNAHNLTEAMWEAALPRSWVNEGEIEPLSDLHLYEETGCYYLDDVTKRQQGFLFSTPCFAVLNLAVSLARKKQEARVVGQVNEVIEAQDPEAMAAVDRALTAYRKRAELGESCMHYTVLDVSKLEAYLPPAAHRTTQYDLIVAHPTSLEDRRLPIPDELWAAPLGQ